MNLLPAFVTSIAVVAMTVSTALASDNDLGFRISSDFAGGSATVLSIDAATQSVHIEPAVREGRGWPCWWSLRLSGLQPGRSVTLKVSGTAKPFRDSRKLAASWALPDRAAISPDNESWSQTSLRHQDGGSAVYTFDATAETMWAAWGPPFLPSHADSLIQSVADRLDSAEVFELARTRDGRPVRGLRIGPVLESDKRHFGVWVQARQHAWEAGSSWVGRGFIEWVSSDDAAAVELRKVAVIYYIPIMDIDNVALGAGGKDAVPRDHNRDWDDKPVYPEVAAAQKRILTLDAVGCFDVFLDLHNPGPSERRPYFFGPMNLQKLPAIQQQNYARWIAIAQDTINGPLPLLDKYRFTTYVKTQEELNRMSGNWVRNHTSRHVLAATLETVWNTPHSTQTGYMTVGRQLGRSLARYLTINVRQK